MARFCTSCGTQQSADGMFCENCGVSMARPAAPATPPPTSAPMPPRAVVAAGGKGFPVMLAVGGLIALLAVGGLIALLFSGSGSGPGGTAQDFFWALEQGNVEEARGLMGSQLRALLSDDKLDMVLARNRAELQQRDGLKDIEIVQETINGERAVVQLKLVYGNGVTDTQNVNLVQEEGAWKISADK